MRKLMGIVMERKTVIRNEKGQGWVLSFNNNIYPVSLLKQAVDDFKDYADIEYSEPNVVIRGDGADKKNAYEFFNYLLALRKNEN